MAQTENHNTQCYECKVCWYVYDPSLGDDVAQIPAGTPFAQLPDSWICPECDGSKLGFLPVIAEN